MNDIETRIKSLGREVDKSRKLFDSQAKAARVLGETCEKGCIFATSVLGFGALLGYVPWSYSVSIGLTTWVMMKGLSAYRKSLSLDATAQRLHELLAELYAIEDGEVSAEETLRLVAEEFNKVITETPLV